MGIFNEGDGGLRNGGMGGGEIGPLGNGINHLVDDKFGTLDIHLVSDFKQVFTGDIIPFIID